MTSDNDNNTINSELPSAASDSSLSLLDRFHKATALVESSPGEGAQQLEHLQVEVAHVGLFSTNESLHDISTPSLPLLALEHHLAVAYTRLPAGPGNMKERRRLLVRSMDLWAAFLQTLDRMSRCHQEEQDAMLMTPVERNELETLLECSNNHDESSRPPPLPAPRREDKIARFQAKQQAQKEVSRLQGLRERRTRMGVASEEIMDDLDEETLDRTLAMTHLLLAKAEAFDEWAATLREMPMILRMIQMEEETHQMGQHTGRTNNNHGGRNTNHDPRQPTRPATLSGLNVTHITLDGNHQLQFRKEEIKSQVFRPGWNQPTMSLAEFGDRERTDAMEREARQKVAEEKGADRPRRYDQLQRDGMEDNADKVDASAALDQAWDDWKDENPRGSGNKRGDQGDRNF